MIRPVTGIVLVGLAIGAVGLLLWMMRNATTLFVAVVQRGTIVKLRGTAPKALMRDIAAVVRVRPVSHAQIRVFAEGKQASVQVRGDIGADEVQRLRNLLGLWPVAKIRSAPYRRFSTSAKHSSHATTSKT